jgi:RecA/RadA recombinase
MVKKDLQKIKDALLNDSPEREMYISSSCSLLNLALSDRVDGGFEAGTIISITGERHSAKSLTAGSVLATLAYDKNFDDYELIYHDTENGFRFDKEAFFGKKGARRIVEPEIEKDDPTAPHNVYDLSIGIKNAIKKGKPFVYVVDSVDGLTVPDDLAKAEEMESAYIKGKDTAGTYGTAKAKFLSNFFPRITKQIEESKSLLILISQTRDNVGGMAEKTRSGGKAIAFYSGTELWLKPPVQGAKIEKTVNGKKDQIGSRVVFTLKKNRISGKPRSVQVVLYIDYGIDDISTSLEWLINYGYATGDKKISIEGIDFEGTKDALINYIEENNLEGKLQEILQKCWLDREKRLTITRKPRFADEED